MTYSIFYEALKQHGVRGTTLDQLLQETEIPKLDMLEIIRNGMKKGVFERWTSNDTMIYRVRPDRRSISSHKLYK